MAGPFGVAYSRNELRDGSASTRSEAFGDEILHAPEVPVVDVQAASQCATVFEEVLGARADVPAGRQRSGPRCPPSEEAARVALAVWVGHEGQGTCDRPIARCRRWPIARDSRRNRRSRAARPAFDLGVWRSGPVRSGSINAQRHEPAAVEREHHARGSSACARYNATARDRTGDASPAPWRSGGSAKSKSGFHINEP